MRFNRLDLNLLVALDALLSEKSITRASGRLNLSQSATSGVLARLAIISRMICSSLQAVIWSSRHSPSV